MNVETQAPPKCELDGFVTYSQLIGNGRVYLNSHCSLELVGLIQGHKGDSPIMSGSCLLEGQSLPVLGCLTDSSVEFRIKPSTPVCSWSQIMVVMTVCLVAIALAEEVRDLGFSSSSA